MNILSKEESIKVLNKIIPKLFRESFMHQIMTIEPIDKAEVWYFYSKNTYSCGLVNAGIPTTKKEIDYVISAYSDIYVYVPESYAPSWVLNEKAECVEIQSKHYNLNPINPKSFFHPLVMYKAKL